MKLPGNLNPLFPAPARSPGWEERACFEETNLCGFCQRIPSETQKLLEEFHWQKPCRCGPGDRQEEMCSDPCRLRGLGDRYCCVPLPSPARAGVSAPRPWRVPGGARAEPSPLVQRLQVRSS